MHEVGIVENVIQQACTAAKGRRIREIDVVNGELSSVSHESLAFYFGLLQPGTAAAEARLVVRAESGRARCSDCRAESAIQFETLGCPACGSPRLQIISGDRLALEAVEVD
jgi:hydrogenase nickel incorporation protein HypA/HybF